MPLDADRRPLATGRKRKLIEAIHGLQPARLTAALLKQEGGHVLGHLEALDLYLAAMPGGAEPNPAIAARVRYTT